MDSCIIKGMILETNPMSARTYFESIKVAIFTCPMDSTQTETKCTILLHSTDEEDFIHKIVRGLSEMVMGVIVVGEKISEMAILYIDKYKMNSEETLPRHACEARGDTDRDQQCRFGRD